MSGFLFAFAPTFAALIAFISFTLSALVALKVRSTSAAFFLVYHSSVFCCISCSLTEYGFVPVFKIHLVAHLLFFFALGPYGDRLVSCGSGNYRNCNGICCRLPSSASIHLRCIFLVQAGRQSPLYLATLPISSWFCFG